MLWQHTICKIDYEYNHTVQVVVATWDKMPANKDYENGGTEKG